MTRPLHRRHAPPPRLTPCVISCEPDRLALAPWENPTDSRRKPMNKCVSCGQPKPEDAVRCPSCQHMDKDVMRAVAVGTPNLTLLVLALLVLWIYRFWILGWAALLGNLR